MNRDIQGEQSISYLPHQLNHQTYKGTHYDGSQLLFVSLQLFLYVLLLIFMTYFTVRAKKTEVVPDIQRSHPSRKMADNLFLFQYLACLTSLILKLATMFILLLYVLDYLQDDESHTAFRISKTCNLMSWTYLYIAYNCILYQWVFCVHRANLYGD